MRIEIDYAACAGTGMCESFAPEVFRVEDDGSLTVLQDQPAEDLRQAVLDAEESCPTEAISVLE